MKEEGAPIENVQREDFLNAQPNAVGRRMRPRKLSPVGAPALAPRFVQAIALSRPISKIRQLTPPRVEREGSSTMRITDPECSLAAATPHYHGRSVMKAKRRGSLSIAALFLAGVAFTVPTLARDGDDDDRCAGARDVKLVNGRIHTLDGRNTIVSSVTIKNGKFAAVGREGGGEGGAVT